MKEILDHHSHLKYINLEDIALLKEQDTTANTADRMLKTLPYFKIASLKSINSGTINLEIKSSLVPSCVCGDGCRVNLKVSRLLQELLEFKSPFIRCSSHMSYGTIRCLCTSETMSQIDAKGLYENLKALLKHFSQSPKSSEMLHEALNMLEMNDIHLLNWGSTRMAGFLDAYIQASNIIVPFLDTVISGSIRPDETKFLTSPKGNGFVYLLLMKF